MEFKDSRTFANLMSAFAGESQARNKYTFYAQKAKDEGYQHIASVFEETAKNEQAHAKIWFDLLRPESPDLQGALEDAAGGEHFEWSEMYSEFEKIAREEGYERIAFLFANVAKIEKEHEDRFRKYITQLKEKKVFSSDQAVSWKCQYCGYEHDGTDAPEICPICGKPRAFFANEKDVIS